MKNDNPQPRKAAIDDGPQTLDVRIPDYGAAMPSLRDVARAVIEAENADDAAHPERLRAYIATAALPPIVSRAVAEVDAGIPYEISRVVKLAVAHADALLAELAKEPRNG